MLCGYPPFYSKHHSRTIPKDMRKKIMTGSFDFPEDEWSQISEMAKDIVRKWVFSGRVTASCKCSMPVKTYRNCYIPAPYILFLFIIVPIILTCLASPLMSFSPTSSLSLCTLLHSPFFCPIICTPSSPCLLPAGCWRWSQRRGWLLRESWLTRGSTALRPSTMFCPPPRWWWTRWVGS